MRRILPILSRHATNEDRSMILGGRQLFAGAAGTSQQNSKCAQALASGQPVRFLSQTLIYCDKTAGSKDNKDGTFWKSLIGRKSGSKSTSQGIQAEKVRASPGRDPSSKNQKQQNSDKLQRTGRNSGSCSPSRLDDNKAKSSSSEMELRSAHKSKSGSSAMREEKAAGHELPGSGRVSGKDRSSRTGEKSAGLRKASSGVDTDAERTSRGRQVRHDERGHKFVMDLDDGQMARIDYRPIGTEGGKKVVEMYHTEVPEELRGRGIGRELARGALKQALRSDMKCKLTCSYLIDYLKRYASDDERKSIVAD